MGHRDGQKLPPPVGGWTKSRYDSIAQVPASVKRPRGSVTPNGVLRGGSVPSQARIGPAAQRERPAQKNRSLAWSGRLDFAWPAAGAAPGGVKQRAPARWRSRGCRWFQSGLRPNAKDRPRRTGLSRGRGGGVAFGDQDSNLARRRRAATSCSQSTRASQAALRPDGLYVSGAAFSTRSSHARPSPDFRYFSRNRAAAWSGCRSL